MTESLTFGQYVQEVAKLPQERKRWKGLSTEKFLAPKELLELPWNWNTPESVKEALAKGYPLPELSALGRVIFRIGTLQPLAWVIGMFNKRYDRTRLEIILETNKELHRSNSAMALFGKNGRIS